MPKLKLLEARSYNPCDNPTRLRPYFLGGAMGGSFWNPIPGWHDIDYEKTFSNLSIDVLELKYKGVIKEGGPPISISLVNKPSQVAVFHFAGNCEVRIRFVVC